MARSTPTPAAAQAPQAAPTTKRSRKTERIYLIRRRIEPKDTVDLTGKGKPTAWLEVGEVNASSAPAALDAYAKSKGDAFDGGSHEAVSARYRLERTASKHVQTTIKWT